MILLKGRITGLWGGAKWEALNDRQKEGDTINGLICSWGLKIILEETG